MYDEISLIALFEEIGFKWVNRCAYHESRIENVDLVEMRDDLIIEGMK